jgi:hypothetical protein
MNERKLDVFLRVIRNRLYTYILLLYTSKILRRQIFDCGFILARYLAIERHVAYHIEKVVFFV